MAGRLLGPPNYPKLLVIKKKYDPTGLFFAQALNHHRLLMRIHGIPLGQAEMAGAEVDTFLASGSTNGAVFDPSDPRTTTAPQPSTIMKPVRSPWKSERPGFQRQRGFLDHAHQPGTACAARIYVSQIPGLVRKISSTAKFASLAKASTTSCRMYSCCKRTKAGLSRKSLPIGTMPASTRSWARKRWTEPNSWAGFTRRQGG